MCGIYGSVFGAADKRAPLEPILASLARRGPDGSGSWTSTQARLAHARLRVLDLSTAADQPMHASGGECVVVFNGEIYNHSELRAELEARGCTFVTRSDTEVIVQGYLAYGAQIIERLAGMFAIGIWDARTETLLLARDRVGKKPLFYAEHTESGFQFASTIAALVAGGVAETVDAASLPSLLAFGFPHAPLTLLEGVRQLPPRHTLTVTAGLVSVLRAYAAAPFVRQIRECREQEAVHTVRKLVRRAVEARMVADVPIGALLSGGLDSSIVVAEMAAISRAPIATFSIAFREQSGFDESRFSQLIARRFGTRHEELRIEPEGYEIVPACVDINDGPFGDSSSWPTSVLCELARRSVTVALSGDGGDELFAGYQRFRIVEATEHLPRVIVALLARAASMAVLDKHGRSPLARASRLLHRASLPLADRMLAWQTYFGFDLDQLLVPGLLSSAQLEEPRTAGRELLKDAAHGSTQSQILHYNFETYLPDDLLVKADRASMACGLELRSPLLDQELVEFASTLPDRFKRRGSTTKWLLRKAYADVLPREILERRKMGFGAPLSAWLRGPARGDVAQQFREGAAVFQFIQRPFVLKLLREHDERRADHVHLLWLLLTLAVWTEQVASRNASKRAQA